MTTCASPDRNVAELLVARAGGVLTVVRLSRKGGEGGNGDRTARDKNRLSRDMALAPMLRGLAPTLALAERALAVELELVEQELAMPAERRPSNLISHWHASQPWFGMSGRVSIQQSPEPRS